VYVEIHNNREESYIVTEELVSHITISLYCLIIFFYFTTQNTFLIFNFLFWSGTRTVDFVERERERERERWRDMSIQKLSDQGLSLMHLCP